MLQPGSTVPTTFLDIHTRLLACGERGLLGLALHSQYPSKGRSFVYYIRSGDGALVEVCCHVAHPAPRASRDEICCGPDRSVDMLIAPRRGCKWAWSDESS